MSRFTFRSLQDANRRYIVSTDRLTENWRNANEFLSDKVGWFDTYGDGDTQHCPTCAVPVDMFGDFCASAATQLLQGPPSQADDLARVLYSEMNYYGLSADAVRDAAAVEWKEGKRRYVNRDDNFKVSSSDSKRYDKRWDEICEWMDGSFRAVVGMMKLGGSNFLRTFNELTDLAETYEAVTGRHAAHPWQILDWLHWDANHGWDCRTAFMALLGAVLATVKKDNAKRALESYVSNMENRARLAAEKAAEVAA